MGISARVKRGFQPFVVGSLLCWWISLCGFGDRGGDLAKVFGRKRSWRRFVYENRKDGFRGVVCLRKCESCYRHSP